MTAKQSKELCGEHEAKIEYLCKRFDSLDAKVWAVIVILLGLLITDGYDKLKSIPSPVRSAQASTVRR